MPSSAAVELSAKYINDRKLPDKAIDVIDEAGASQMLVPESRPQEGDPYEGYRGGGGQDRAHPVQVVIQGRRHGAAGRWRPISARVGLRPGQGHRAALSSAIKMARAGLREPDKPIGSFLFSGPTGVGKTEVARQLAFALGVEFLRFDMSEYMERHTVAA